MDTATMQARRDYLRILADIGQATQADYEEWRALLRRADHRTTTLAEALRCSQGGR